MKKADPSQKDRPLFDNSNHSTIKLGKTKQDRVFIALLNGWSGTIFQAEIVLHDHHLPTTIFNIEKKYSVTIQREWMIVPGFENNPTRVMKYSIAAEEREYYLGRLSA